MYACVLCTFCSSTLPAGSILDFDFLCCKGKQWVCFHLHFIPIQGRQKHFSFDQVKYSGGVICLCIGCMQSSQLFKQIAENIWNLGPLRLHLLHHTANIGLMVSESARPVLLPLIALLLGRAMQCTNLQFEISLTNLLPICFASWFCFNQWTFRLQEKVVCMDHHFQCSYKLLHSMKLQQTT